MTLRRVHFETTVPAKAARKRRQGRRASRAIVMGLALAGLAWGLSGFNVSPSELDFGGERVGEGNLVEAVEIANRSLRPVQLDVRVEGESASDFQYQQTACAEIAARESCALPVQFAPHEPGKKRAALVIRLGQQKPYTVALTGTAFRPVVAISPSALEFGDVTVGSSASQKVWISGEGWFHIHSVSFQDHQQQGFRPDPSPPCLEESATPKRCFVSVEFRPPSAGEFSATLVINDDALGSPHLVRLRGNGVPPTVPTRTPTRTVPATPTPTPPPAPTALITPAEGLDFSVDSGAPRQLHVLNGGNAPLVVKAIRVVGENRDRFQADKDACSEIAPNSECLINVSYHGKPNRGKSYIAELTLDHNAVNIISPQSVELRWTAPLPPPQASLSLRPDHLIFSGTVVPGKPVSLDTKTILVRNDGPSEINNLVALPSLDSRFFGAGTRCKKLPIGGTCEIRVNFSGATEAREYRGSLDLYEMTGFVRGTKLVSVPLAAVLSQGEGTFVRPTPTPAQLF